MNTTRVTPVTVWISSHPVFAAEQVAAAEYTKGGRKAFAVSAKLTPEQRDSSARELVGASAVIDWQIASMESSPGTPRGDSLRVIKTQSVS
jgi:hypothetical protein